MYRNSFRRSLEEGWLLIADNEDLQALESFQKVIDLDSQDIGAWYSKGMVLLRLERHEEALETFQSAIGLDPQAVGETAVCHLLYAPYALTIGFINVTEIIQRLSDSHLYTPAEAAFRSRWHTCGS